MNSIKTEVIEQNPIWVPNSHDVTEIYPLQKMGCLAFYSEKLEKLKKNEGYLGATFIRDELNQPIPIYLIKKVQSDEGDECEEAQFFAHDLQDDTLIGSADTVMNQYAYGEKKEMLESVYLMDLRRCNSKPYKNVGVTLIKAILQQSMGKYERRMSVFAINNSAPFYYYLGFRVSDPKELQKETLIARLAASKNRGEVSDTPMYLPDSARELWRKEIEQNPIQETLL
jgi:hypothetical protein